MYAGYTQPEAITYRRTCDSCCKALVFHPGNHTIILTLIRAYNRLMALGAITETESETNDD